MEVTKKKFYYYIGYLNCEGDEIEYSRDIKIKELTDFGIFLLIDVPNITRYTYITNIKDIKKAYRSKKLSNLLLDIIAKNENEEEFDNYDELILDILDDCCIIRENRTTGACKILNDDKVIKCYDDVLDDFLVDVIEDTDSNYNNFGIDYESGREATLEDIEKLPETTVDPEPFHENVLKCMTNFKLGQLTMSNGTTLKVVITEDGELKYGETEEHDVLFRKTVPYLMEESVVSILKVITDSKIDDNEVYEVYGFYNIGDKLTNISADEVRNSIPDINTNSSKYEYAIFRDIDGGRVGNLID